MKLGDMNRKQLMQAADQILKAGSKKRHKHRHKKHRIRYAHKIHPLDRPTDNIEAFTTYPDPDHPWIKALLEKGMKFKTEKR